LTIQLPEQLYYLTLMFLAGFVSSDVQDKGNGFQIVLDLHMIIFNSWSSRQTEM